MRLRLKGLSFLPCDQRTPPSGKFGIAQKLAWKDRLLNRTRFSIRCKPRLKNQSMHGTWMAE